MPQRIIWAFLICILINFNLFSQDQYQSQRPSFTAVKVDDGPLIDGNVLTDSLWQSVTPITDLKQIKPT